MIIIISIFNFHFLNNLFTLLYQAFLCSTNDLHTFAWFQVFQSNTNNYFQVIISIK